MELKSYMTCVALLASAAPLAAQGASAREDSVRATEMARRTALLAADTMALSKLVAAEFVEISRLGQVRPRAANLREIATGTLKLLTVRYDASACASTATWRSSPAADNTGTYLGAPFSGKIRYTRVFVWRDGHWQAVAMQQTSMPE